MLLSMTGFGTGRADHAGTSVSVELRTVNNRHLKVSVRGTEPYPRWDAEFEKVLRTHVRRGTVTVHVRVERAAGRSAYELDLGTLNHYLRQLEPVASLLTPAAATGLYAGVLSLPGVAPDDADGLTDHADEWRVVTNALELAARHLTATRRAEGTEMARELRALLSQIEERLQAVRELGPAVAAEYRRKILERVRLSLSDSGTTVDENNLIREVAIFADRSDISEEQTRLTGHISGFRDVLGGDGEGAGRRLEFLVQEMGREANTMGSKAGNAEISRHVVEIKATLEKIRELVLNIE